MRIGEHFHLQDFLYQTFLYATKHLKLSFYKNRQQMMPASIINV